MALFLIADDMDFMMGLFRKVSNTILADTEIASLIVVYACAEY